MLINIFIFITFTNQWVTGIGNLLSSTTCTDPECYDLSNCTSTAIYSSKLFCSIYYVCHNGNPKIYSCFSGLLFNEETYSCDYDFNVNCGNRTLEPVTTVDNISTRLEQSTIETIQEKKYSTETTINNKDIVSTSPNYETNLTDMTSTNVTTQITDDTNPLSSSIKPSQEVSTKHTRNINYTEIAFSTSNIQIITSTEDTDGTSTRLKEKPSGTSTTGKIDSTTEQTETSTTESPTTFPEDFSTIVNDYTTNDTKLNQTSEEVTIGTTDVTQFSSVPTEQAERSTTENPTTFLDDFSKIENDSTTNDAEQKQTTKEVTLGTADVTQFSSVPTEQTERSTTENPTVLPEHFSTIEDDSTTNDAKLNQTSEEVTIGTADVTQFSSVPTEQTEKSTTENPTALPEHFSTIENTYNTNDPKVHQTIEVTSDTSYVTHFISIKPISKISTTSTSPTMNITKSQTMTFPDASTISQKTTPQVENVFICPTYFGYFPDPVDCNSFYQCSQFISYKVKCPAHLHFNRILNVCDWPYNAGCDNRTKSTDETTIKIDKNSTFTTPASNENITKTDKTPINTALNKSSTLTSNISNKEITSSENSLITTVIEKLTSTSTFATDTDGTEIEDITIANTVISKSIGKDETINISIVDTDGTSPTTDKPYYKQTKDTTLENVFVSKETNITNYKSVHISAVAAKISETNSTQDIATENLINYNLTTAGTTSDITETMYEDQQTDYLQNTFTCPRKYGLFPNSKNCNLFYQCSDFISYQFKCPFGLHFNQISQICDWPYKAGCGNQGNF